MAKFATFVVAAAAVSSVTAESIKLKAGTENGCDVHALGAKFIATEFNTCFQVENGAGRQVSQMHTLRDGKLVVVDFDGTGCAGAGTEQMIPTDVSCTSFSGPFDANMPQTPASVTAQGMGRDISFAAASGTPRTLTVDVTFSQDCSMNRTAGAYGASVKVNFKEGVCTLIGDAIGQETFNLVPANDRQAIMVNTAAMKVIIDNGNVVFQTFSDPACTIYAYSALASALPVNKCMGPAVFTAGQAPMTMKITCDGGNGCRSDGSDDEIASIVPSAGAAASVRASGSVAVAAAIFSVFVSSLF